MSGLRTKRTFRTVFQQEREDLRPILIGGRIGLVAILLGVLPVGKIRKARSMKRRFQRHHGRLCGMDPHKQ
jgi:hypothetical protein